MSACVTIFRNAVELAFYMDMEWDTLACWHRADRNCSGLAAFPAFCGGHAVLDPILRSESILGFGFTRLVMLNNGYVGHATSFLRNVVYATLPYQSVKTGACDFKCLLERPISP